MSPLHFLAAVFFLAVFFGCLGGIVRWYRGEVAEEERRKDQHYVRRGIVSQAEADLRRELEVRSRFESECG